MVVAIHQPEFLPWLGLLDKARRADVLVLFDDVQFNRRSLQHRCKIASPKKPFAYLTIPFTHSFGQLIRDVKVAEPGWQDRHRCLIEEAYSKAPGYDAALPTLQALWRTETSSVAEIASLSMAALFQAFDVRPGRIVRSGDLGAEGHKGDRVLDICKRLGATRYLSGRSGAEYLNRETFAEAGVEIEVQSYAVPTYREGQPTEPGLSALDAWMHLGDRARDLLTPPETQRE